MTVNAREEHVAKRTVIVVTGPAQPRKLKRSKFVAGGKFYFILW